MKEKYQIKKWIENVIKSALNWEQLTTCEKLVINFENQMKKEDYDVMLALPFIVDLKYKIELKRKDLLYTNHITLN